MGLRARLLLLVLLPAIPALILALYTNLELRQLGATRAEKDAMRVAQLAAENQSGLIAATGKHLAGLSHFPQTRGNDLAGFKVFFAGMLSVYRDYTDFGLIETNGDLVACASKIGGTNFADRADFQRVLKSHSLAIGDFQSGSGTNKPFLPFAFPVLNEEGHLLRVLYASLDLTALNRALSKGFIPEEGVIELFDRSGHVLWRSRKSEEWIGKSFAGSDFFSTIVKKKEGTAELSGLDRVTRLYAFETIQESPEATLFVSVGIPAALAYANPKHLLAVNLTVLSAATAIALMIARTYASRHILHPIHTLSRTTAQVAAGNLGARTGITQASGELNQLAVVFDKMAASLQQQRSEAIHLNATLERRVMERTWELEGANRELEAFSYSVAHDLRTPLRHINGYVAMLEEEMGTALTEKEERCLKTISESASRMGVLIDDLLAFSHVSRMELKRKLVNSSDLVQEVLHEIKRDTEGRNIHWKIEALPEVLADRAMLKQVWANLLSNAVKYTRQREQTEIKIGFKKSENEFEFFVQDNGAGFDMRYASKLFGVFQRLHREDEFEGTGIGLANVRRIIQRHGGRTWAEGEIEKGASFFFSLPSDISLDGASTTKA